MNALLGSQSGSKGSEHLVKSNAGPTYSAVITKIKQVAAP